jgi:hypothetical protein
LIVADTSDHAERLVEEIRQQAAARRIVAIGARLATHQFAEKNPDTVLLPPVLDRGELGQLELAWQRTLTPLARQGHVICVIRQDVPTSLPGMEALVRWESVISFSVVGGPFTALCVYDDPALQQLPADIRTRIIAAHSVVSLESESTEVLLAKF